MGREKGANGESLRMEDAMASHTFSREPDFSENEKVGREKGSQWGVPAHGRCYGEHGE